MFEAKLGGKGAGLTKLKSFGYLTPEFVVIEVDHYRYWKLHKSLPLDNLNPIFERIKSWGDISLAVRSSSTLEDSAVQSFAGQFKTLLGVKFSDLADAIEEVYRSADEVCKNYSRSEDTAMAVVVQRLLNPQVSGVAFSRRPVGDSSLVLIESIRGLGKSLVDGEVVPDRFEYDRFGNLVAWQKSTETVGQASLNFELGRQVMEATLRLESDFRHPVDIEWSIEEGHLYILQVRPITQKFRDLVFFCDTNLIESYPGISSPLTISIVKKVYFRIFLDSARFLGASASRISKLVPYYENMIGSFSGHLYYNMNSYFAAIAALPGGRSNLSAWLNMIGSQASAEVPTPNFGKFTLLEYIRMFWALLQLLFLRSFRISRFHKRVSNFLNDGSMQLSEAKASRQVAGLIGRFLSPPFSLDVIPLNDLVLMKLVERRKKKGQSLDLKTNSRLSSTEPDRALEVLAHKLSRLGLQDSGLWLGTSEFQEYLEKYGDRSFEDLKLEAKTFRQDPEPLLRLLKLKMLEISKPLVVREIQTPTKSAVARAIVYREELRFTRSKYFGLLRDGFHKLAKELAIEERLSFDLVLERLWGLSIDDIHNYANSRINAHELLSKSQLNWRNNSRHFPEYLCTAGDADPLRLQAIAESPKGHLSGIGASRGSIRGVAMVVTDPKSVNPAEITSSVILVTETTDPAWVFLMTRAGGLLSERGSLLSHTAIIGRELNLPTVVGARLATQIIQSGDIISIDGETGAVEIHSSNTEKCSEHAMLRFDPDSFVGL